MNPGLGRAMIGLLTVGLLIPSRALPQNGLERARDAHRRGDYEGAVDGFSRLLRSEPGSAAAARGLVASLAAIGRYEQAERATLNFMRAHEELAGELQNSLGELLHARGAGDEAEAAFGRAMAASDSLSARLNRAIIMYERGAIDEAFDEFDHFIDVYNSRSDLSAAELVAVGRAAQYLGAREPQLFKDALRAFDEAIAADPGDPDSQVLVGELFLAKYNSSDAAATFAEVLESDPNHPRALLGQAKRAHFDGEPGAFDLVQRSLDVNPNYVDAHVFLAELYLEAEKREEAEEQTERALAVNPTSLETLATLAAIRLMRGDRRGYKDATRRALSLNPRYADLHVKLADVSARVRRYEEAADFAREAILIDRMSWRGHALLGVNLMRLGRMEEGRRSLETAFEGDPYDVWTKNTLDLLDSFERFEESRSPRLTFLVDRDESELLSIYLAELGEEAFDALASAYGYRPEVPVRVEVYPNHADFSVRTIGLAGLGALGVSFGPVIAMDSPGAREIGHFNWGSTLWHELAHTFHLGMTDHRVPRWFTEGLAVFEERRARSGWGERVSPGFLLAYKDGRLLPIEDLNDGFVRPTYPRQIIHSYYLASLVCEYIAQRGGYDALVRMLEGYGRGLGTPGVVERVLGMSLDDLDREFYRYFEERFSVPLAALDPASLRATDGVEQGGEVAGTNGSASYGAQLALGKEALRQGDLDRAEEHLLRARALFPQYAGPGNPYAVLAQLHEKRGDLQAAAAELAALTSLNGRDYAAHLELADLRERLGEPEQAARALERAIYVYPFDLRVHEQLAELAARLGDYDVTVRERHAALALDPTNRAEALYDLASAYQLAGNDEAARRAVLEALELAPNYRLAQELLLELHERDGGERE